MNILSVRILTLDETHRVGEVDRYWESKSYEDRLSAVEILRRQYGKLATGEGYGSNKGIRRVLRVVKRA